MAVDVAHIMFCPRCNRPFSSSVSEQDVLDKVIFHVSEQHPDHDPEWHDTFPQHRLT